MMPDDRLAQTQRLMDRLRPVHQAWRRRRRSFTIIAVILLAGTITTLFSLAAAFIGGVVHPITFLSCFLLGATYGVVIAQRPDRGLRRRSLWFDYAVAALDQAADLAGRSSLRDKLTLLQIAEGIEQRTREMTATHLAVLAETLPRVSPELRPLLTAHLHLALAAKGVDLRLIGNSGEPQ